MTEKPDVKISIQTMDDKPGLTSNAEGTKSPGKTSPAPKTMTSKPPPAKEKSPPRNAATDKQMSEGSTRRRTMERRRSSAWGLPHVDDPDLMNEPPEELENLDLAAVPFWTSHRFRLAILCFFGFMNLYMERVSLTIAIVTMSSQNHSVSTAVDNASATEAPDEAQCNDLSHADRETEFHWSKNMEGLILGSFYWGYLVTQIPGGRLAEKKLGACRVITMGMLPTAVLSLMSPMAARMGGPIAFLVLRIVVGLGEGVMYPAVQALWSKWAPPNERSRLVGLSYAGGQFGNALIFPLGGYLCAEGFDGGWPSVFYITGILAFVWCVLWMFFAHDSPNEDKGITELEKNYVVISLGGKKKRASPDIPWKRMLTNKAVLALTIVHMCGNYGYYMLLTKIPAYMKEVLKFDIKSNGAVSMLPYLCFWACITLSGMLADCLISNNKLSVGNTRKLMSTIGTVGPAGLLVATGFISCQTPEIAVALLTVSGGLCGFAFAGYFVNHGDIAPPFAGTLFGITNTAATLPGFLSPVVVSALTPEGTQAEWQNVFYVAAVIYLVGAIVFIIFGSGEVQDFAQVEQIAPEEPTAAVQHVRSRLKQLEEGEGEAGNTEAENTPLKGEAE